MRGSLGLAEKIAGSLLGCGGSGDGVDARVYFDPLPGGNLSDGAHIAAQLRWNLRQIPRRGPCQKFNYLWVFEKTRNTFHSGNGDTAFEQVGRDGGKVAVKDVR
jgi:hypothetical protein